MYEHFFWLLFGYFRLNKINIITYFYLYLTSIFSELNFFTLYLIVNMFELKPSYVSFPLKEVIVRQHKITGFFILPYI